MLTRLLRYGVPALAILGVWALASLSIRPTSAQVEGLDLTDHRSTMIRMVGAIDEARQFGVGEVSLFEMIGASGDPLYIAPLLDVAYFVRGTNPMAVAIADAADALTGNNFGNDWQAHFEWAGRENIETPPSYGEFKGLLLSTLIDPEFARFFPPGVDETARVNLAEPVWGGVRVDGIPSLVNARQITPVEALAEGLDLTQYCNGDDCAYPAEDEFVFGVSIDGDARAYPLRLLNWHEMFNDVIGSTPMLAELDGDAVCNFRAPTAFDAIARSGDDWVQIAGESAGCPTDGWLAVEALEWATEDGSFTAAWEAVRDSLPDAEADEEALAPNDGITGRVSGRPVMLAYCTLCGSGVLYDATVRDVTYTNLDGETVTWDEQVLEFGSTGMLMRSNKLMYDRTTDTVWNAITGQPAFGPLATSDLSLEYLPVVVTDWASWLEEHPDTSVLSLDTGFRRDYTNGAAYADYFNAPELMFPVWQQNTEDRENKAVVFGLQVEGERKAYPIDLLIPEAVTNDTLNGLDVVLVTREAPQRNFSEPGGAAVRAYASDGIQFGPGENDGEVVDADGNVWTVTEDALVGPDGQELERLGGHLAFWFGWFSFFPDTLVYEV